jgi:hypothetical protein
MQQHSGMVAVLEDEVNQPLLRSQLSPRREASLSGLSILLYIFGCQSPEESYEFISIYSIGNDTRLHSVIVAHRYIGCLSIRCYLSRRTSLTMAALSVLDFLQLWFWMDPEKTFPI